MFLRQLIFRYDLIIDQYRTFHVTDHFDNLKESIIEEASRMEKSENIQNNDPTDTFQNSKIKKALNEIEGINKQIDLFNKNINNQIK